VSQRGCKDAAARQLRRRTAGHTQAHGGACGTDRAKDRPQTDAGAWRRLRDSRATDRPRCTREQGGPRDALRRRIAMLEAGARRCPQDHAAGAAPGCRRGQSCLVDPTVSDHRVVCGSRDAPAGSYRTDHNLWWMREGKDADRGIREAQAVRARVKRRPICTEAPTGRQDRTETTLPPPSGRLFCAKRGEGRCSLQSTIRNLPGYPSSRPFASAPVAS